MLKHRCPVFMTSAKRPTPFLKDTFLQDNDVDNDSDDDSYRKPPYSLWVYDLESSIVPVESTIPSYVLDENGYLRKEENGSIKVIQRQKAIQVPNLVVYKNVFTGEVKNTNCIPEFLNDLLFNHNNGRNVVLAHNGSGYDNRLMFDALGTMLPPEMEMSPLLRGTKLVRLQVGNTIFGDTMLHLSGSLADLADNFLKGDAQFDLEKGEFPHFFNRAEFKDYEGEIPADKHYDLTYALKDDEAMERHRRMKKVWEGRTDWNAQRMLEEYCLNDVNILAAVVLKHHYLCLKILYDYNPDLCVSPWHFTTAAGYMHKLFFFEQRFEMSKYEKDPEVINRVSGSNWTVLEAEEHYCAKNALRGGRTEVRKHYHDSSWDDPAFGPISTFDVRSMYPSVQIGKSITVMRKEMDLLYPVGAPLIEVHDSDYYPCSLHFTSPHLLCSCTLEKKKKHVSKKITVKEVDHVEDLHAFIQEFDGIVMIDATPPRNIYHPLLPFYDQDRKKCIYSCENIVGATFPSPILKVAIRCGYKVTKIYRADRYKMMPSKWRGLLGAVYKIKYYSSKNIGDMTEEEKERHHALYLKNFDIDIDFAQCSSRKAVKRSSKTLINSPWGKLAESVDHVQSIVVGDSSAEKSLSLYRSIGAHELDVRQVVPFAEKRTIFHCQEVRNYREKGTRPNLSKVYMPCAVFLPMYGQ